MTLGRFGKETMRVAVIIESSPWEGSVNRIPTAKRESQRLETLA